MHDLTGRGRAADVPAAPVTLRLGRAGLAVETSGQELVLASDMTHVGAAVAAAAPAARSGGVDIVIAPGRYLARPLSELRLPRSRATAMAALDVAAATPFRPDDCHLVLAGYREGLPDTRYFLVRRDHFDPLVAGLRRERIPVRRVLIADGPDLVTPDAPSRRALLGGPDRPTGRLANGLAIAAAVGLVALVVAAHWRYQRALGAIDVEIAAAEADAAGVRKVVAEREALIAQVSAARAAKSEAVPLTRILEEMARTIPDGTWLTDLDFRNGSVTFSGISDAAPELIPALDASPLFRGPTFSQPVVRAADQGGDRFTVTMGLEDRG